MSDINLEDNEYTFSEENEENSDINFEENIEEYVSEQITEEAGVVSTVSDIADESLERALDKLKNLGSSTEVQSVLSDLGLTPYLKDVTKDRVKTILSFMGLWYLKGKFKNKKVAFGLVAAGAGYLMLKNDNKILSSISNKIV